VKKIRSLKQYALTYEKSLFRLAVTINLLFSQEIALVKYSGGGDWYANPTSLPNLIKYCNANINTKIKRQQQ
jgi:oligoribonuclease NrnB/cAMP/cGMP phosphodiesterase (DHH superfamily)